MRKIIISEFVTVDGVMEAPEKWQFPYISDDMAADIQEHINTSDSLMLGRVTYEIFAASWPSQTHNEFGIADKLNSQPKFVVSTTLKKADWNNSTIISTNAMAEIARLKQQPGGDIAVTGSATLVQSLAQADLIDEYRLYVHPIVLGKGIRLFNENFNMLGLKLVENKVFQSGVAVMTYQPDRKA